MTKDSDLETLKTQILAVYNTTIFSNVSSSTQRNINEFGTISDNEKVYRFEKAYFKIKSGASFIIYIYWYRSTRKPTPFDTDHTGEGIKDKFLELFHKWGLDKDYCVMLVLDGASNMTLAAKKMGLKDVNEEFLVDFDRRHQQHTNNYHCWCF